MRHFYQFGNFRLDLAERVLLRDGKPLSITPKVFHLLQILVERHGQIVEKNKLIAELWADSFVEEGNLAFNVRMLRKALKDDAANPIFVETVPRRGYRFIAEVEEIAEENPPKTAQTAKRANPFAVHRSGKFYLLIFVLLAALTGLLAAAGFWRWREISALSASSSAAPILSAPFRAEKFSASGNVHHAVISPDGKSAAYITETGGRQNVWVRRLETAENVQIVPPSEAVYMGLAFSRDGNLLYFARRMPNGETASSTGIFRVPAFGGIPFKITEKAEGWFSLSPDNRQISFVRCEYADDDFCSLFAADAADGKTERKILTRPRPIRIGDNQFAPDGKSIAFAAGQSWNGGSDFRLLRIDLQTGAESEITPQRFFNIKSLTWLPDGGGLLFTASEKFGGKIKIWRVSLETGEAAALTKDAADYLNINLDKNAARMIATQIGNNFRLFLSSADNLNNPKTLTAAREFTFAPDGGIVYSDFSDIWAINRDGGGQRQLTNHPNADFRPRTSPDGRFIFFCSNRTGSNQVWRMNADGSGQIQLTETDGGYPTFVTADGKWVYFESGVRQTLWRVSADGGGGEMQISDRKMYSPAFSPDGSLIAYFFRDKQLKIGVMSIADKKQIRVFDYGGGQSQAVKIAWSGDNRTLNFITAADNSKNSLWQKSLDDENSQPRFLADLGDEAIEDFTISPKDGTFGFTRGKWLYDAVLIDGLK